MWTHVKQHETTAFHAKQPSERSLFLDFLPKTTEFIRSCSYEAASYVSQT